MDRPPDISALDAARARLAALAERQHAAARAAAHGASLRDVAALMGVSLARASGLMARPAFAELVAFYRAAA
jgi:hypothetical protein